jgi:hypothetical protein
LLGLELLLELDLEEHILVSKLVSLIVCLFDNLIDSEKSISIFFVEIKKSEYFSFFLFKYLLIKVQMNE